MWHALETEMEPPPTWHNVTVGRMQRHVQMTT